MRDPPDNILLIPQSMLLDHHLSLETMYRKLCPKETLKTIHAINSKIEARFPHSGLNKVCKELCIAAKESKDKSEQIGKPNWTIRFSVAFVILLSLMLLVYSLFLLDISVKELKFGELVQIAEAGINNLIFIGVALFFLVTFETRIKRSRALKALHELRAITHVIDMHQLSKNPSNYLNNINASLSPPKTARSREELIYYLDYCSEMLSMTGKVAALYAQKLEDEVVLSTVNELENLVTGLCRKIWQKIMILNVHNPVTETREKDEIY